MNSSLVSSIQFLSFYNRVVFDKFIFDFSLYFSLSFDYSRLDFYFLRSVYSSNYIFYYLDPFLVGYNCLFFESPPANLLVYSFVYLSFTFPPNLPLVGPSLSFLLSDSFYLILLFRLLYFFKDGYFSPKLCIFFKYGVPYS